MKCSNCNQENKPGSAFCSSCGSKLNTNEDEEKNSTENVETTENIVTNPINNNQNQPKKKNIWLIIGIIAAVLIILIAVGSGGSDTSISPSYGSGSQTTSDKTKLENYLTDIGWRKQSSSKYTYYKDGYTYTMDFDKDIYSQSGDSLYSAYYYKEDIFATVVESDGLELVAGYSFNTYSYTCETTPSSYQSYACSYMKTSVLDLGESIRNSFYVFIRNAGVSSVHNL